MNRTNTTTIEVPMSIDELIKRLSVKSKIELAKRLQVEARRQRWTNFFSKIDRKLVKSPVTQKEINRAVREVRKELYG